MQITIALAKGRLADKTFEILKKCGINPEGIKEDSRKLIYYDTNNGIRFLMVKPTDVPTYVDHGVADLGVVGKDTLLEIGLPLYEMIDLKFGACKMCIAGYENVKNNVTSSILRVATKYPETAKRYYEAKGKMIEVIKLNGSIELAPIIGLSDVIMDLVESGRTLKENGLVVLEEVCDISARLTVNRVSLKTKADVITPLLSKIRENIGG
ncbi:MAG: ATP phosphoribosyltransferase [Eubacteriales bacterium]